MNDFRHQLTQVLAELISQRIPEDRLPCVIVRGMEEIRFTPKWNDESGDPPRLGISEEGELIVTNPAYTGDARLAHQLRCNPALQRLAQEYDRKNGTDKVAQVLQTKPEPPTYRLALADPNFEDRLFELLGRLGIS